MYYYYFFLLKNIYSWYIFMKIVQFLPNFKPYEWELSSVAWEFAKNFVSGNCWEVLNVVFAWGEKWVDWYEKDWYKVLFLPSISLGANHFIFKFWSKKFWNVLKWVKGRDPDIVQTHGRSFLPTIFWLFFSLKLNKKWVYISHKSWYKKWLSRWRLGTTMLYDHTLWRLTFWFCNNIITLTNLSSVYIKGLTWKKVNVVYRGVDFPYQVEKEWKQDFEIRLCFVWNLLKKAWIWVLLRAFDEFRKEHPNTKLSIIWDWSKKWDVEKLIWMLWMEDSVELLWKKTREEIQRDYLKKYDVVVVPTLESDSLIQEEIVRWLLAKTVVVATDIWAVKEITDKEDLILVKAWDISSLFDGLCLAVNSIGNSWLSYDEVKEQFSWNNRIKEYLSICYP